MKFIKSNALYKVPMTWNDVPYGIYYKLILEKTLYAWWPKLYGHNLLKFGALSVDFDIKNCTICNQINIGCYEGQYFHVISDLNRLPFLDRSIDVCFLAHTLSYIDHPYILLQEASRVLNDEGWIIITTFNSFSLFGLVRLFTFFFHKSFGIKLYTQIQLLYWLKLLNFEIIYTNSFRLFSQNLWEVCLLNIYLYTIGGLNIIIARKRTIPVKLVFLYDSIFIISIFLQCIIYI